MKLKRILFTITALLGVTIATSFAGDPSAKTKAGKTTAKSKAKSAEAIPGADVQPAAYFYTGKPFDEDLGGYVFNYRTYSPNMNRWLTTDPSGFPDGANNHLYAPVPTTAVDPFGLAVLTEQQAVTIDNNQVNTWKNQGWTFAANVLANFVANTGNQYTGTNDEAQLIKNSNVYRTGSQKYFNDLGSSFISKGAGTYDIGQAWNGSNMNSPAPQFNVRYTHGQLFDALGGAHFYYTGTMTVAPNASGALKWSVAADMQQVDYYTFNTKEAGLAAMAQIVTGNPGSALASWRLENVFGYKPFFHVESFSDNFAE